LLLGGYSWRRQNECNEKQQEIWQRAKIHD
jgi:hypothetical protein